MAETTAQSERITVTGTRIRNPNLTSNTQTTVIDAARVELSGEANTADILRELPSVGIQGLSSTNSNFFTSNNGVNSVDLRNLGTDRTLVLVNGRRFVSGISGSQVVDLNSIPTAMIERIDVVTGGASAVYGSDALAGVVNFILRDDFEGLVVSAQHGWNEVYESMDTTRLTVTGGANFDEGRGNAVFNLGWDDSGPAYARSRPETADDCLSGAFFGLSYFEQFCTFRSSYIEGGVYRIPTAGGATASTFRVLDADLVTIRARTQADSFNRQALRLNLIPFERYTFSSFVDYEVFEGHNVFFEGTFASTESRSNIEPFPHDSADVYEVTEQVATQLGDPSLGIDCNNLLNGPANPFVPAAIVSLCESRGVDAIGYQRRMTELGNRGNTFQSDTFRVVLGMEGPIGNWDYEVAYNYGRTTQLVQGNGQINVLNMRQALNVEPDGLGGFQCADPVARLQGCVPINIFLPAATPGSWTPDQIAWIEADSQRDNRISQEVLSAQVTGDLFDNWAGPVQAAFGVEYRQETSEDIPDALSQSGQNGGNVSPKTLGEYDVFEGFAEINIPLIMDAAFADELSINAAGRWSDYSTLGSTFAWSGALIWQPTEDVRFRTQYAEAVRAPNIGELFTGPSETFGVVVDACNNLRTALGGGPLAGGPTDPNVIANCLLNPAILARADSPTGFVLTQPELQGTGGFQSGNPNLREESGTTFTIGAVFTPKFWSVLEPLTISVDYFDIEIEDAIALVGRNTTINLCYTSTPPLTSPFCANLVRDVNGALIEVNTGTANSNLLETSGVDVNLGYLWDLNDTFMGDGEGDIGSIAFSVLYTYLDDYTLTTLAGTPFASPASGKGDIGFFESRAQVGTVYTVGDFQFAWTANYVSRSTEYYDPEACEDDGICDVIPAQWFHDVQFRYDVFEDTTFIFGVRNVDDNFVFIGQSVGDPVPTGWVTAPDAYDGLGRRYYIGLRSQF